MHLTRLSSCLPCDVWLHSSLFSCYFSLSRVTASSTSSSRCQMSVCVRYVGCLFVSMDLRLAVIISIVYIFAFQQCQMHRCVLRNDMQCAYSMGMGNKLAFHFSLHMQFFFCSLSTDLAQFCFVFVGCVRRQIVMTQTE